MVHPLYCEACKKGVAVGAGGSGGSSPSSSDGTGGRSQGRGGAPPNLVGVPPPGLLLSEGPFKFFPEVPPFAARRASRGSPGGADGPGGHSPSQASGPGWRSLDQGGAPPNLLGVFPPNCEYPGTPAIFLPGTPSSAARHAVGGVPGGAGGPDGRSPSLEVGFSRVPPRWGMPRGP